MPHEFIVPHLSTKNVFLGSYGESHRRICPYSTLKDAQLPLTRAGHKQKTAFSKYKKVIKTLLTFVRDEDVIHLSLSTLTTHDAVFDIISSRLLISIDPDVMRPDY